MIASILSPLAHPFHPIMGQAIHPIIFNNGVPSLVFQGSKSEFLHSISDQVLDDAFPPSAEDAAELEAAELFVNLMLNLAILEEREEAARSLHVGLKKRWEARRGLMGKPRAPRHRVTRISHGKTHIFDSRDIVLHDNTHTLFDNRMRAEELLKKTKSTRVFKKNAKIHGHSKVIQQPRKKS